MYHDDASDPDPSFVPRLRRSRRNGEDRAPFNRIIVLRDPSNAGAISNNGIGAGGNYEIYYDDGTGSTLRPLPSNISEFLMGSGFDRLLNQLAQLEVNGVGSLEHPPASKAAIESLPVVKILASHVPVESHCAVCKEPFELDSEAREMPCKHIYHSDCILPWLSIRNSCPVCRHQLPTDGHGSGRSSPASAEEVVGLTIWRLPGGGFAVGRFTWGRGAAEHDLPVVYTEIDGGFSTTSGIPRRISWASSGRRSSEGGGFRRVFRNFFSFFGRFRSSSHHSSSGTGLMRRSFSSTLFNRRSRRNNHLTAS
ncbi:probable E3 ubiquitin-protein ligase RHC2A [Momordica charantia]|uniref:RING-type E3 ubiquitin transferase n=1 Tax=Momordica charantia TaxID=3673 RepID=A0A6J1CXJ7_MOMCH|nr:probable E3 ubiquitin-protein ligase RHC2A [Momordica charantia]